MEFKDRLRKAMNDNGLNARELSKRCGLSEASISRYLLGQMEPKVTAVCKMAEALRVDKAWLMGLDITPDYVIKANEVTILAQYLTPSEIDKVLPFVKYVISLRDKEDSDHE